jgi:hypothetical protein
VRAIIESGIKPGLRRWLNVMFALGLAALGAILSTGSWAAEPAACGASSPTRQLDYWLGDWSVSSGSATSSNSRVDLELDGCLVVEHWDDGRGHSGQNLFAYSTGDQGWRGLFADNKGRVHVFVNGQVSDGRAEFLGPSRGPNGEAVLNRIRLLRNASHQLEQIWEKSSDEGKTWTTQFRLQYSAKHP